MTIEADVADATANAPPIAEAPPVVEAPAADTDTPDDWETSNDADLKAIFAKHNPTRDEGGRFLGKSTGSDSDPAETAEPNTEVLPDQPPIEEPKQVETPAIQPPQSWSADVKEKWAALPPDIQNYVLKRESETHSTITRQGQELKAYEPLRQVVEQNKDIFERNGVTVDDGLSRLLTAERLLETNPVAAIGQLAQAYGVDLRQFGGHANPDSAQDALHQEIAFLKSQMTEFSNRNAQRERAETQTQQHSMTSLIESFAKDKSDWADLENDILTEITGIKAAVNERLMGPLTPEQMLAKAYERAQRNNPAVFAKKLEAEREASRKADEEKRVAEEVKRKADEATRIAEAKKRAEAAKASNAVNVKSTPANGRTISSMDDDLRAVFRKNNTA